MQRLKQAIIFFQEYTKEFYRVLIIIGHGEADKEKVVLNLEEERLFKAIFKIGKRPMFEVPTFLGNLNPKDPIDWINELNCFEYEDIDDLDKVKFVKEKLKGCAKI